MKKNEELVLFNSTDGKVSLPVTIKNDSVWLTLDQVAELFGRDKSTVSRHIHNVFRENELDRSSTVAKNATVQFEGSREIERMIDGNKRIADTIFLYFLDRNGILYDQNGDKTIDDHTLVALTIMIAESRPEEKELMISVIMNCIE